MAESDDPGEQLERALAPAEVGRLDGAEAMLRRLLSQEPDDPDLLAILALVLSDSGRPEEALEAAGRALAGDPDSVMAHMGRAHALLALERPDEALAAAWEAVRLDPDDADTHQLVAVICGSKGHWDGARSAAERALAIDPESEVALGIRAGALAMTSRDDEWRAAARETLAAAPHDAVAHTLAGVAHLYGGGERDAVEHFREALRLDPGDEAAQAGLAEAMKAAHPLFRPMFRFFLWQERVGTGTMVAIWIGGVVVVRLLWQGLGGVIGAVALGLWLAFLVLTWAAVPLANLLLRTSRVGRTVLPKEQKRSSSLFGLLLAGAVLSVPLILLNGGFAEVAFVLVFLAFAAGSSHALPPGRRQLVNRAIIGIALCSLTGGALIAAGVEAIGAIIAIAAFVSSALLLWVVRLS
jgi:tetratricopeptide (TPR) repeat protein